MKKLRDLLSYERWIFIHLSQRKDTLKARQLTLENLLVKTFFAGGILESPCGSNFLSTWAAFLASLPGQIYRNENLLT